MAHRSPPAPPERLAALIAKAEERLHAKAWEAVIRLRQRFEQRQERQPAEPGNENRRK